MAKQIKTDSDVLSLVLRCQYTSECWQMENGFALEEEVPEPPKLEEEE